MEDQSIKRRARFVPVKMSFQPTRSDESLSATGDEWWARIVCYAFSLPPLPFVKQQNRATAENAVEEAPYEGLAPMMVWFKGLIDHIIQVVVGFADLEMVWDDSRKIDPHEQDQMDLQQIAVGRRSIDEARISRGEQPIGMTHAIWGIGPAGIMFVDDLLKLKQQGLLLSGMAAVLQPPAPAMPGMAPGGAPMAAAPAGPGGLHPDAAAALAGVDPKLLAAVGLGAAGPAGRSVDVTAGEAHASDPLSPVAAHPTVLRRNGGTKDRRNDPESSSENGSLRWAMLMMSVLPPGNEIVGYATTPDGMWVFEIVGIDVPAEVAGTPTLMLMGHTDAAGRQDLWFEPVFDVAVPGPRDPEPA
jgi:hypothetical protein